ncbi:MAG: excinuclease ABC subunit UvrC [Dysgonamonadaceae bacterium]|jgi:excinuclease ABC subunit C|nr:excinuclease ABC subunit UvrC [Dysgonamonadaceae bacterium]
MNKDLSDILSTIPDNPGCYMYLDENDTIIYIGKAKNLKRRVHSYFNKTVDNPKTQVMMRKVRNIRYLVVETEEDAFLLENSLIKQHKPRYNIMLKDDKTYPWVVVKNEPYPRVFLTRSKLNDKSHYYGPYPSVTTIKHLLRLLTTIYPIRNCNYALSTESIDKKKFRVCLQYHIKRCLAPCAGQQSETDYNKNISAIEEILKGNVRAVSRHIYDEMMQCSAELKFEEAAWLKERYRILENYSAQSLIATPSINNVDVFAYEDGSQSVFINYLHIVQGSIVQGYTVEYSIQLDEPREQILGMGIIELRTRFGSNAAEIIVPFEPDIQLNSVTFTVPKRGDRYKLLELSKMNARQYRIDRQKQADKLNPAQRATRILKTVQNDLHLKEMPVHIECFDNSNLQGTNPVSSCAVFIMAKPSKKDYRHFNIKTVVGPDDFSSMFETLSRRYRRMLDEEQPLPQLVVIDGGKGQLHAAADALKSVGLYGKIAIIGIAKRLEEIYFPEDSIPLYLDKQSETLRLIQRLRDEAHRFGITFHRSKRSKQQIVSELDTVKGIGRATKERLLKEFKSVKRIKEASEEELAAAVGEKKAELLRALTIPVVVFKRLPSSRLDDYHRRV